MKPFLKWAGNKYPLLERIKAILPVGRRLIEPFVGSGAVFLNTQYSHYLLNDTNADLINMCQYLKNEKLSFIAYCKTFFLASYNQEEKFYELRMLFNTTDDLRLKAALFLYLNKHCYNGLCRYNAKGEFNTPFGKYKAPYFPEKEMHSFAEKAQQVMFTQLDFIATLASAESGDVVYCDPPYVPLSKTAHFTAYSSGAFGEEQQLKLAAAAEQLAAKGIPVIISNHATEFTRRLYHKAHSQVFDVQRYISCNGVTRAKVAEILAVFN